MFRVGYVGGGFDLYVVFDDKVHPYYASVHVRNNWRARFRDTLEGHAQATAKAEELNRAESRPLSGG